MTADLFRLSSRIERLPAYLFVEVSRRIAQKRAEGVDVISFAIGDPDLPTPESALLALEEAAREPANHRYPETDGLPELRAAIATWYERRFHVALDPEKEVLPLIGSKEGIAHIALCLIDPGDVALVPDPSYPVYAMGTTFAGGEPVYLPLTEEHNFLPDLNSLPTETLERAKLLWLNYPNNPTGAVADVAFFERAAAFGKQHRIAICHDAPYTEVAYGDYRPPSFLQAEGARDAGIEFHSFSKSFNMSGWRIGMAVGNATLIDALMRVKSNLDSGIPQAIQRMAIAALNRADEIVPAHNAVYERRRDKLTAALEAMGLAIQPCHASLYLWARIPDGMTSAEFALRLLDETGVVVTPGTGYGACGEGFIRLSLTVPDARLEEGVRRLQAWRA